VIELRKYTVAVCRLTARSGRNENSYTIVVQLTRKKLQVNSNVDYKQIYIVRPSLIGVNTFKSDCYSSTAITDLK
jgi:hypothetical protein